jgi:hypothetical protein
MPLLPLRQGCALLGIDPKTLRHWMHQANLPVHSHPTDARIKCLTSEHIEQLAALHQRPLDLPAALARVQPGEISPALLPEKPSPQAEPDLLAKLAHLETQVALLQQHLAGLALELLQERTQRYEHRLHTLAARIQPPPQQDRSVSALPTASEQRSQPDKPLKIPRVHPAKGRPRAILPLIEYTADCTYLVICPHQGELALTPDSPEWFAWLATLSSFRFVGQRGRLSAYRKPGRTFCWFAYRRIHHHRYEHALGRTDQVTIDHLEQMTAQLQSSLVSL